MISQDVFKHMLLKQIKKAFSRYPEVIQKFYIMASDIVSKLAVA